ncbi:hypothetical protein DOT_0319 [Desulfosporosinus sp. OT]|nr:hypothetical protein DOT_0319 [Desulfosporosinus sp. OT]
MPIQSFEKAVPNGYGFKVPLGSPAIITCKQKTRGFASLTFAKFAFINLIIILGMNRGLQ